MKMIVKVDDFNSYIKKIDDNNGALTEKLEDLKKEIGELKLVWQGNDSEQFTSQADNYIEYLKSVPKIINDLNEIMKKASITYKRLDQEYAEKMKKAVVEHE